MKSRSHRLPTISDTPDDWVDESWTVDCVCGVNFDDGEEMVDCDECGVWVHTRCSKYVKSEKLFACDKCKNKKLRKESEETEVAQLLVELPTKTLRMDNPYPMSYPPQSSTQVSTEIPLEKKAHVQGIPGGDPALFSGASSVFSPELWKCTGYVPKKFNHQYREFPCWDERQDDDNKGKDEIENHDCKGADTLYSLSKENALPAQISTFGGMKTQVTGGAALDMGPPTTDTRKPVVIHSGNQKKDDSKVFKDLNRTKNVKAMDKEGDSKKKDLNSYESADAKQSESYEGKDHKVFKTDKQADVQANHKSDGCLDNNTPENVPSYDSRLNPSKEAKQMEENDGNQDPPSVEISPQTEDGMASSPKHNLRETITIKDEVVRDVVVDANDNDKSSIRSNGTRSNANTLEKGDLAPNDELHASSSRPIKVKPVEINHPGKTYNSQNFPTSDLKLDSSKTLAQDTRISNDRPSASFEVKKDGEPDESGCSPSQPKGRGSEGSTVGRSSSEGHLKSHGTVTIPSGAPYKRKVTVSAVVKSKPSVSDNNIKSEKDNTSSELPRSGDAPEKPRKFVKELPKSSSTSALKSSHLSKKNPSEPKDPVAAAPPDSGESANSHEQKKSTSESTQRGEKSGPLNRHHPPKNHPPHVHPPTSTNSPATLSDEELALLLHQELNSSPRVPRVPRMRHAGSIPQLAATTPTSTLMKRTSSSGGKDNGLMSRKRNKDFANNGPSNSREFHGAKKSERLPSSRRHDLMKNASANDKNAPPASTTTTTSSGPSSSNEANEHNMSSTRNSPHNASDEEIDKNAPTNRTLPGLIAEIMSKGKRMTYEELCNAVLPHWPNLRKHNGERYAYSSHSQAVLDCLRNRSEWSRLVDRGPKTNAGRKRRKPEADEPNLESEDDDYSKSLKSKQEEFPKGKRKARTHRRLALQGRQMKDVRRRRKAEVVSDDIDSSSDSSEESEFSEEDEQGGGTSVADEASASSDETATMS